MSDGDVCLTPNDKYQSYTYNDNISENLLSKFDNASLTLLQGYFQTGNQLTNGADENATLQIDQSHFIDAITNIFDHSKYSQYAIKLFKSLDYDNTGFIQWDRLIDKFIVCKKYDEIWMPVKKNDIRIEDLHHCKKESIAIIIIIETSTTFCYVVISKHGKVGLYDGKFMLLSEYDVFFIRTGVNRRVRDIWITAATFFNDAKTLILMASDKSMMIYDASTLCHVPIYLITGMISVTSSLSYNTSDELNDKSYLIMGDDLGGVTTIIFKQPRICLFYKKWQDKLNSYYWIDVQGGSHDPYCKIKFNKRVHSQGIKRILYVKHNNTIISCSCDPNCSVVIQHIKKIREPYIFKVPKGVTCFYYSETLGILVTGGADGCVRLWEPVVPTKASSILPTQNTSIIDVIVLSHMCIIISLNKNGVLKVWNILECSCIQSINVRFPSFGILGKPIQFGFQSMYCGATRRSPTKPVINPGMEHLVSSKYDRINSLHSMAHKEDDDNFCSEIVKWNCPEIIVTCCNHIAVIPLDGSLDDDADEESILPPPEKTLRPKKPSVWDDDQFNIENISSTVIKKVNLTTVSASKHLDDDSYEIIPNQTSLKELLQRSGLTEIMKTNFVGDSNLTHNMNTKLAYQRPKHDRMRLPVSQGFPYTALDLYDHDEITFSFPLPLSERMKKISGLEHFGDPQSLLKYDSCFAIPSPKTSYTTSDTTNNSKNFDTSHKRNG